MIWREYYVESKMQCDILEEWDDILSSFSKEKQDIYFTKKYLSLYENERNTALCAVCIEGDKIMLMPYLRGKIQDYYDFETAYGYGGPISNTDETEWCNKAFYSIYDYLKNNNYLCGFTRFHPLLGNEKLVSVVSKKRKIQVLYDRQTIAIDTSQSPEEIWTKQISSKNRNMIRKAEKNQLEYGTEHDFKSYDEFIQLYNTTMKRLNADDFYFFDRDYYYKLKDTLSGNSFLGTVRKDGKLICAAIFMYSELYGHYHLEGSDRAYSSFGANNYLLWKVACEMHELGITEFHLGGGTSSALDDPLYKFKKAFSGNEKQFHIGKEIFLPEKYEEICEEWKRNNPDKIDMYGNRLLKYRYSISAGGSWR